MAQFLGSLTMKFTDNNGAPYVGGMLYSYAAGTNDLQATYADGLGNTENDNPLELDSNGEAVVYLGTGFYKFVLEDSEGNTIFTRDNISAIGNDSIITAHIQVGAITTTKIADGAIITEKLGDNAVTYEKTEVVNEAISDSCGDFSHGTATPTDVTNLSVDIETHGRTLLIFLEPDGSAEGVIGATGSGTVIGRLGLYRDDGGGETLIRSTRVTGTDGICEVPPGAFFFRDKPNAGEYTYSVKIWNLDGDDTYVKNCKLNAVELK